VNDAASEAKRRRRERARTAALVVLGILLTLFAVLNVGSVKVDWIVGSSHAPLIIVIAVAGLVGAAILWLAERASQRRRGR
jgi:uncharacterized integral membrane protein